jgi:hypothetical protein
MFEVLVYSKVYIVPVFLNIAQIESFQSRFKVLNNVMPWGWERVK